MQRPFKPQSREHSPGGLPVSETSDYEIASLPDARHWKSGIGRLPVWGLVNASVAQQTERRASTAEVAGANPAGSTISVLGSTGVSPVVYTWSLPRRQDACAPYSLTRASNIKVMHWSCTPENGERYPGRPPISIAFVAEPERHLSCKEDHVGAKPTGGPILSRPDGDSEPSGLQNRRGGCNPRRPLHSIEAPNS